MINEEKLKAQREAIVKQRDDYMMQANGQIAYWNGEIAILDKLLNQQEISTPAPHPNGQHEAEEIAA